MPKTMLHAEYQERIQALPSIALRHIAKDAREAVEAMPDGPNAGYYADEVSYCNMELRDRAKNMVCREEEYTETLTRIFIILKESGYCGSDMIDDLRDLVNDSQREAEADE